VPRKPIMGIATFSYPFVSGMPNIGDEFYYSNYETYSPAIEDMRERMALVMPTSNQ